MGYMILYELEMSIVRLKYTQHLLLSSSRDRIPKVIHPSTRRGMELNPKETEIVLPSASAGKSPFIIATGTALLSWSESSSLDNSRGVDIVKHSYSLELFPYLHPRIPLAKSDLLVTCKSRGGDSPFPKRSCTECQFQRLMHIF